MKKTLRPIIPRDWYSAPIEAELTAYLRETLFDPLDNALGVTRQNAHHEKDHSILWDALIAGLVWYAKGVFTGAFNAAISRELRAIGARRVGATFALAVEDMPLPLRGAIAASAGHSAAVHAQMLATLDAIEEHIQNAPTGFSFQKEVDNVVEDLQEQLVQTVSSVEGLAPPTPVPQGLSDRLRETIVTNLDSSIKDFTLEQTQLLRARVRANLQDGGRVDRLHKIIEAEFGVSKRKARFLADQETSLAVSDFRRERYQALGSTEYLWETSHDEKVRPTHGESNNHRVLDGRRFSWDNPPVVDSATGRRCHPGEDYGPCRCLALPIVNLLA